MTGIAVIIVVGCFLVLLWQFTQARGLDRLKVLGVMLLLFAMGSFLWWFLQQTILAQ